MCYKYLWDDVYKIYFVANRAPYKCPITGVSQAVVCAILSGGVMLVHGPLKCALRSEISTFEIFQDYLTVGPC